MSGSSMTSSLPELSVGAVSELVCDSVVAAWFSASTAAGAAVEAALVSVVCCAVVADAEVCAVVEIVEAAFAFAALVAAVSVVAAAVDVVAAVSVVVAAVEAVVCSVTDVVVTVVTAAVVSGADSDAEVLSKQPVSIRAASKSTGSVPFGILFIVVGSPFRFLLRRICLSIEHYSMVLKVCQ
jgi:hypothetical protein